MPTATSSPAKFGDPHQPNTDTDNSSDEKEAKNCNPRSPQNAEAETTEEIYTKVLEEAPFIDGGESPLIPIDDIPWLDVSLIKIGMDWFHEYVALYAATTVIAMLSLAVSIKPISALIFRNDKPMKPDIYFRRFLGKLRGIEKFYTELLNPVEARKVFYKTRKLHEMAKVRFERVATGQPLPDIVVMKEEQWMRDYVEAVKKDVASIPVMAQLPEKEVPPHVKENLSWDTQLPFNQFGMVYFTAGFFGVVWLRPHLFGMKSKDDIKMKALIHMWAIFAKLLGLQDEFNIYINPNPELIDRITRDVYLDSLGKVDTVVMHLQRVVAVGIAKHIPFLTHAVCLAMALKALGCEKVENMWKVMSLQDRFNFKFLEGVFYLAGTVAVFRHFTNWLFLTFIHWLYVKVLDKNEEKNKYE